MIIFSGPPLGSKQIIKKHKNNQIWGQPKLVYFLELM